MRVRANAKINWTLDVTGQDGQWHTLDMIMDSVSLYDPIELEVDDTGEIFVSQTANVARMQDNLMYRAAALLQKETGVKRGVRMHVEKNIPSGAGLGGGSADAAAVLRALNEAWDTRLDDARLAQMGLSLGADVPYCLLGGRVRAKGRGEILFPCAGNKTYHLVLAMGRERLLTGSVFAKYDEVGTRMHPDTQAVERALSDGNAGTLAAALAHSNALQQAACALCPDVKNTLAALERAGALCTFMTGSGACCVGLFADEHDALLADAALGDAVFWHRAVHTVYR